MSKEKRERAIAQNGNEGTHYTMTAEELQMLTKTFTNDYVEDVAKERKETPIFSGVLIPNYGGRYEINTYGDILSVNRSKMLRPHKSKSSGYFMCTLINEDGGKDVCYLHQLMAITFIDKDYKRKGLVVDHIDRDRSNNDIANLRVVTSSVNNENRESKGYYFCSFRNKFSVSITRCGVKYRKRFKNEIDAIKFIKNIKKNDR
jgi:hypothetical protein